MSNAFNAELNDLRIIICLRKYDVTIETISVCNVTEKKVTGLKFVTIETVKSMLISK